MGSSTVISERRAPWWRTALLGTLCAAASITSFVFSELAQRTDHGWQIMLTALGALVALALPVLLGWRHRAPYAITLAASVVAIVLPVGTWTALAALGSLISRRRGRDVWLTACAVAAATIVTVVRDVRGRTSASSLVKLLFAPADAEPGVKVDLPPWVPFVLIALGLAIAVGAGLALRARREAAASAREVQQAQHVSNRLGDELARQRERERIGREVHDVLGHRLSLLNLHAGALEVHAEPGSEVGQSARLVRQSAARSMDDLRSLLSMLQESPGHQPAEPDLTLVDLPAMIEETIETGVPVSSAVFITDAGSADSTLARAVYRIVQELLTNARRHAPGQQIQLEVRGGPDEGLLIEARNRAQPGEAAGRGGQGLRGIGERVELLGGHLVQGLDDGGRTFRVTVRLPWRSAAPPGV